MSRSAIGVGLVGYGLAGRVFHGMLIKATPGLEVRAVVTQNPSRRQQAQADFPGVKVYARYEELLDDPAIDLVVIGTPHDTHKELAVAAAARRKHIVVDKIMALSVAEADEMIRAAKTHGVLLSVFQNRRWDSDFLTVQEALARGWIGEPYVIESSVVRYSAPPDPEKPMPWRMQARHGGGPFRDWGAHLVDQAVQLFGTEIESVYADFQYRWPGVDVETAAVAWIRFKNGVRYRIEVGHISKIGRPRWYVRGDQGALVIEGLDPQEAALKEGRVVAKSPEAAMPKEACTLEAKAAPLEFSPVPGDYLAYYENIAGALLRGVPLAVTAESARNALAVIEAAVESAATGQVVTVKGLA
jgi:Predicted dehydrogenases and related proteins